MKSIAVKLVFALVLVVFSQSIYAQSTGTGSSGEESEEGSESDDPSDDDYPGVEYDFLNILIGDPSDDDSSGVEYDWY